jgi:hypothetical protein
MISGISAMVWLKAIDESHDRGLSAAKQQGSRHFQPGDHGPSSAGHRTGQGRDAVILGRSTTILLIVNVSNSFSPALDPPRRQSRAAL